MEPTTNNDPATEVASVVNDLENAATDTKAVLAQISERAKQALDKGVSWSTAEELFSGLRDIIALAEGKQ